MLYFAGGTGINHGVEIHQDVIDYAQERLQYFLKDSYGFDQFEFAEPKFTQGMAYVSCRPLPLIVSKRKNVVHLLHLSLEKSL